VILVPGGIALQLEDVTVDPVSSHTLVRWKAFCDDADAVGASMVRAAIVAATTRSLRTEGIRWWARPTGR
jgi:hypothetical protein